MYSYYGTLIVGHMWSIAPWHFWWPWVTIKIISATRHQPRAALPTYSIYGSTTKLVLRRTTAGSHARATTSAVVRAAKDCSTRVDRVKSVRAAGLLVHDERCDRRVTYHVLADAAKQRPFHRSDAARPEHYQVGFLVVCDATYAFSGVLVWLATHLEMYLQPIDSHHTTSIINV